MITVYTTNYSTKEIREIRLGLIKIHAELCPLHSEIPCKDCQYNTLCQDLTSSIEYLTEALAQSRERKNFQNPIDKPAET